MIVNSTKSPKIFDFGGKEIRLHSKKDQTISASNITLRNGTIVLGSEPMEVGPILSITGKNVTLEDITITGGKRGLWVKPGSSVTLLNSHIRDARCCIMIGQDGKSTLAKAVLVARNLTLTGFTNTGLALIKAGNVTLTGCKISGSSLAVCISGSESLLTSTGLKCVGNKGRGLLCYGGGRAKMTASVFHQNWEYDVCVEDQGSLVECISCGMDKPPVTIKRGDVRHSFLVSKLVCGNYLSPDGYMHMEFAVHVILRLIDQLVEFGILGLTLQFD